MATVEQVRALLADGRGYESAARALSISPGLAYMLATGVPADGSESPRPQERVGRAAPESGAQLLINRPEVSPTQKSFVTDWMCERATRELTTPDA